MTLQGAALGSAKKLVNFLNESPTPFHAAQNAAIRLEETGFKKVSSLCFLDPFFFSTVSVGNRDRKLGTGLSSWWEILLYEVRISSEFHSHTINS